MEKIHVITRCSRLNNLREIHNSVFNTDKFDIKWYIIFDTNFVDSLPIDLLTFLQSSGVIIKFQKSEEKDHGHQLINSVLDEIENGWIYVLDDDNLMHENFYTKIHQSMKSKPKVKGFIFDQKVGGIDFTGLDIRECGQDLVKVGKIDMAQFILKRDLIGDERIPKGFYVGDGMFIEKLYEENTKEFHFLNEILCYYNYYDQNKKAGRQQQQ